MPDGATHVSGRPPVSVPDVEAITLDELLPRVRLLADAGRRFVTATCLDGNESYEIYYHFADGAKLSHLLLTVAKGAPVPSISAIYLAAFLVENEIKELFGVPITDIAIDYGGHLFLNEGSPVTPMLKVAPTVQE